MTSVKKKGKRRKIKQVDKTKCHGAYAKVLPRNWTFASCGSLGGTAQRRIVIR